MARKVTGVENAEVGSVARPVDSFKFGILVGELVQLEEEGHCCAATKAVI